MKVRLGDFTSQLKSLVILAIVTPAVSQRRLKLKHTEFDKCLASHLNFRHEFDAYINYQPPVHNDYLNLLLGKKGQIKGQTQAKTVSQKSNTLFG
jgi:hypothetical protein